jgi:hypothetical protein
MRISIGVRSFEVEPRELFWGAVIALALGWLLLFVGERPLLAALAIPIEALAAYLLVRPHVQPPPGRD